MTKLKDIVQWYNIPLLRTLLRHLRTRMAVPDGGETETDNA